MNPFFPSSVSKQVHSHAQSKFSAEGDLVLPLPIYSRGQLKCDGTRTETRFLLLVKRTSPFKSAEASVQSTTDSRDVRISGSNAGYTMFRSRVKSTGYPLLSPVPSSLPHPSVAVCHHISTGVYVVFSLG